MKNGPAIADFMRCLVAKCVCVCAMCSGGSVTRGFWCAWAARFRCVRFVQFLKIQRCNAYSAMGLI